MRRIRRFLSELTRLQIFAVAALILLLIGLRVAAPVLIRDKINETLATKLSDYQGSIRDFDLRLIAGSYFVKDLELHRRSAPPGQSLLKVEKIEVNVAWRALWHGRLLLDGVLFRPVVELDDHEDPRKKQTGAEEKNWMRAFRSVAPFNLQSLQIEDGSFHFLKKDARPAIEVTVDQLDGEFNNFGNLLQLERQQMPSSFRVTARVQEHARLAVEGKGSFLQGPLLAQFKTDLKDLELPTLNPFLKQYAYFDITSGHVSMSGTSQIRWPSMKLDFFPSFENLDIVAPQQRFRGVRGFFTEIGVALLNLIARSPKDRTLQTELRLEGDFPHLKLDTWRAIRGVFETRKNKDASVLKNKGA